MTTATLDPGFIDAWREVFDDAAIGFAGGRVELFDPADARFTLKTDPLPAALPAGSLILPGTLHGACLAFRAEVVQTIGGFDPEFGAGTRFKSAEDSEYVQRASQRGLRRPVPALRRSSGTIMGASRRTSLP